MFVIRLITPALPFEIIPRCSEFLKLNTVLHYKFHSDTILNLLCTWKRVRSIQVVSGLSPEDGGSIFLRNICVYLHVHAALHHTSPILNIFPSVRRRVSFLTDLIVFKVPDSFNFSQWVKWKHDEMLEGMVA